jgi:hypothetical protein
MNILNIDDYRLLSVEIESDAWDEYLTLSIDYFLENWPTHFKGKYEHIKKNMYKN